MSKTIDERVVEMRFDNADFERNVQTSLNTLDKLDKSLKMDNVSDGLTSSISKLAGAAGFGSLGDAVETVKGKFSALEVMGVTALANITNSAVNAGKNLVNSLAVQPITDGFNEYELKMGSVQTIMAGTGEDLDVVMEKLNELNTYADKTIYSFKDMTSNIGKFTNAGVKLNDAVAAIQGVSNVAAVSGANAAEASRAMYNFAQALSSGYVKLIDWKSIENANMATVEFKQQLIDTAVQMGTLVKVGDKYQSTTTNAQGKVSDLFNTTLGFNDALQSQWMTTDVLTKTLAMYSDETTEIGKKAFAAAQDVKTFSQLMDTLKEAVGSGWAETFELIFGNFNEAKALWTSVSDVVGGFIDSMSKGRNAILKTWKELGGRNDTIEALKNVFGAIGDIIKQVSEAFRELFPPLTGKQLADFSKKFLEFSKRLKPTQEMLDGVKTVAKALFTVLKTGADVIKRFITALKPIANVAKDIAKALGKVTVAFSEFILGIDGTANLDKFFESFSKGVESTAYNMSNLQGRFSALSKYLGSSGELNKAGSIFLYIGNAADQLVKKLTTAISKLTGLDLSGIQKGLSDSIYKATKSLSTIKLGDIFDTKELVNKFKSAFTTITSFIKESYREAGGGINGVINTIFKSIESLISKIVNKFGELTGIDVGGFLGNLIDTLEKANEKTQSFISALRGTDESNQKLTVMQSILKGIGDTISFVIDLIKKLVSGVGDAVAESPLLAMFAVFGMKDIGGFTGALTKLTEAITSLAKGGDFLNSISESFKSASESITKSMATMAANAKATELLKLAAALGILAVSLVVISSVPVENLLTVFGALTGLFGELMGGVAVLSKLPNMSMFSKSLTTEMIKIAGAILILAEAMKIIGGIDNIDNVVTALLATIGAMLELVGAIEGLGIILKKMDTKTILKINQVAKSMILLGAAVLVLAVAIDKLSGIENLEKGLISAGIALGEFVAAVNFMGKTVSMKTSMAVLALAAGVLILTSAIEKLANIERLGQGLVAATASIGAFVIALQGMTQAIPLSTSLGVIALAIAIDVLAGSIESLAALDIVQLGMAMLALVGSIATLVVAVQFLPDNLLATGAGFAVLAIGVRILSGAIIELSAVPLEGIISALVGIGGACAILAITLANLEKNMGGAAAFTIAAVGVELIAVAINTISGIALEDLAKSLLAIGGGILMLAIACTAMEGALPGAAAMLVASASLIALGLALKIVAAIPFEDAVAGILLLVGALAAFAVTATVLQAAIIPMITLAAAIAAVLILVAAGLAVVSLAIMLFGEALAVLATGAAAGAEAIGVLAKTFEDNTPQLIAAIAVLTPLNLALIEFAGAATLGGAAAIILGAGLLVMALGMAALTGASALMAKFKDELIIAGIAIAEFVSIIASVGTECLIAAGALAVLGAGMAVFTVGAAAMAVGCGALALAVGALDLAFAGLALAMGSIGDSFEQIGNAVGVLADNGPAAATAIATLAVTLAKYAGDIKSSSKQLTPMAEAMAKLGITSAALAVALKAINDELIVFLASILQTSVTTVMLNQAMLDFQDTIARLSINLQASLTKLQNQVTQFFDNITSKVKSTSPIITNLFRELSVKSVQAVTNNVNGTKGSIIGNNFVQGIANGIRAKSSAAVAAATAVGNNIKSAMQTALQVHSPSRFGHWLGENMDLGVSEGMIDTIGVTTKAATKVGDEVKLSLSQALSKIEDSMALDLDTTPTITPVMDLTNIEDGAKQINTLMSQQDAATIAANYNLGQAASFNQQYAQQTAMDQLGSRLMMAINGMQAQGQVPVDVHVSLEGGVDQIFNVVQNKNRQLIKQTGRSPLYS